MNNLSWLLYAADLAEGLNGALLALAIGSFALVAAGWVATIFHTEYTNDFKRDGLPVLGYAKFPVARLLIPTAFGALLAVTPSRQTVYMIAASETGQRMVQTPEARELLDLVRQRVKDALSDPKQNR